MNPVLKLVIYITLDIVVFIYFGKLYGFLGIGLILYFFFDIISFFKTLQICNMNFNEGIAYLKDYQGSFHNPQAFKDSLYLIKNYKLKDFVIIGIYYDKPDEVPQEKRRYSIGIFKKNSGSNESVSKEFEIYCKQNNFYSVKLPKTSSIYSSWRYSNFFTLMVGIAKFYNTVNKNFLNDNFKRMYKINENPKICVELYVTESKMEFYMPIENSEKFFVYRKEEKAKSN